MRLSEDKMRRIAERVIDELESRSLVKYTAVSGSGRSQRIKAVYDVLVADMKIESEIDAEVERILETYSRTLKATERDILRRKHKDEVAKRRNYEV